MGNTPINYGDRIVSDHRRRVTLDQGTFVPNNAAYRLDTDFRKGLPNPSLSMACTAVKAGKLHSIKPIDGTGDFTVSSPDSSGFNSTRINEDGVIENTSANIPRIDFSSGDGELLTEPQSVNLITYPRSFDNAAWAKVSVTVTGGFSSPHVQYPNSGFKFIPTGTGNHYLYSVISITNATQYTISVRTKYNSLRYLRLEDGNNSKGAWFDIQNGVVASFGVGVVTKITPLANGYYDCSITGTSITTNIFTVISLSNSESYNYTANGTDFSYIAFAQLEQQSSATSLMMPITEGSTQQRNADVVTGQVNAANFNSAEGTLFLSLKEGGSKTANKFICLNTSGGIDNVVYLDFSTNFEYRIISGGINQFTGYYPTPVDSYMKIAMVYKLGRYELWLNGIKVINGTTGNVPLSLNQIRFNYISGVYNWYGRIKQLQYYPSALTDAELIALTTL